MRSLCLFKRFVDNRKTKAAKNSYRSRKTVLNDKTGNFVTSFLDKPVFFYVQTGTVCICMGMKEMKGIGLLSYCL